MDRFKEIIREGWGSVVGILGEDSIPFIVGCMLCTIILIAVFWEKDDDGASDSGQEQS